MSAILKALPALFAVHCTIIKVIFFIEIAFIIHGTHRIHGKLVSVHPCPPWKIIFIRVTRKNVWII